MLSTPVHRPRRKPGAVESPYRLPEPGSPDDTPLRKRRHLLRWLRARPDLPSPVVRLLEAQLDRVPIASTNLVAWDSIETAAERSGLCQRSVISAHAELRKLGMQVRLCPRHFEAWLDAVGRDLGFEYPDSARRPGRFSIMLFHLSEADAERARVCALQAASESAEVARTERKTCALDPPDFARLPPIREFEVFERGEENRKKADEKLVRREENSQTPESAFDRSAMMMSLAEGDPFRAFLARARSSDDRSQDRSPGQASLPEPGPSPVTASPLSRILEKTLIRSSVLAPEPNAASVSQLVRHLPGARRDESDRVARALAKHFREAENPVTVRTLAKYLDLVRIGRYPVDLVVGLIDDVDRKQVVKPAHLLSQTLAEEYRRSVEKRLPQSRPGPILDAGLRSAPPA